jgi:hypothetical protein
MAKLEEHGRVKKENNYQDMLRSVTLVGCFSVLIKLANLMMLRISETNKDGEHREELS